MRVKDLIEMLSDYYECGDSDEKINIIFEEEGQGQVTMRSDNNRALIPYAGRLVRKFRISHGHFVFLHIDLVED